MRQKFPDKKLKKFFIENNIDGEIHYYEALGRKIRYISIGENKPATLFFIPGSPASVDLYKDYYKDETLQQTFQMFAVDRPGYGNSGYGEPELSIQKQSEMIRPIIDGLNKIKRPLIICAGSYGASVACRLLMDHPQIADGFVMDAPSLAPGKEKVFWATPIIEKTFIRRLILPHHRTANTEKYYHKAELSKMLPYWKNIQVPVIYIQGDKDKMVYTSNADFAKKMLVNVPSLEVFFIKGRSHVIVIKERSFIIKQVFRMYEKLTLPIRSYFREM